jgi:hypothetical protein
MGYRDREKARIVALRDELFADPGGGLFAAAARDFVLMDRSLNLHESIRAEALDYFRRNGISWWKDDGQLQLPTGHLLSSQVACVNHLFPLRDNAQAATALLRALDPEIEAAEIVDDGFVEFEFIGERQYLKERSFTRGAHCTSVDAVMIGRHRDGVRRMFLIEWKYTEEYPKKDCYIEKRAKVYDELIEAADGPFLAITPRAFYYEPFYQLMRQTLLGCALARHEDHGCASWLHVHVCPKGNSEFHDRVTAPAFTGDNVAAAWRNVLKHPALFVSTTPEALLAPLGESDPWLRYLSTRYWTKDA